MPAAIGAFVVAVGGWGAAIALVLSIAVSAYSVIALKRAQAGSQQERKQILRSATAPFNVIYGKNRSAGTLTFAEEAYLMEVNEQGQEYRGKTEVLFMVVTHAGHPLHKVEGYKLNDDDYNRLSPNQALIQTYKDGAEVSEPMLLKHSPSWRADMVGKGIAWFVARLQFDHNLFPNGVPNINALKWGYEIEDPRTGLIQWTDNPSLVMLHYLKTYLGYSNDELIIETFISAANISDELVSLPEGAGQEARYRIGAEFNIDEEPSSILDKMLATMGGEWVKVGGRLGLAVAAYYGPAVIDITEDDLIDAVELQPEVERQDAFNTVRGKFNDAAQDYIETDYPQVSVAEYLTEDGEEIISSLDLEFVQSPWQCQRLAHIAIQRNRYGMQVKLPCNLRGFKCVPGTVINLRLPGIGLDGVECRVLDWEFSLDNGVVLVVRRESAAMYNDAVGRPLELPPLISSTNEVAAPTNLRFETDVNNDTVSGSLHWSNSAMQLSHTVIKIKAGETVVQTVQVPSPGESIAVVGLAAGNYSLSAIAVAVSGRASPETALNITLAHPVAPSHADVDVSSEGLTIIPHIGDDSQLSINTIFEFYFNVIDDLAGAQRLGQGKMLTKQGLAPDTQYWFWIYTITPLGRSAAPLGIVTRTGLVSGDILEHIDNQVSQKVAQATEELLRDMGSLTDIRGIAEDLDAQILADYLAQGLSELDAQQAAKRVARLMESVTLLSDDQQSLAQTVTSLYARFDESAALVQQKDRAQVGYAIKKNGSPGDATSPAAAEMFGETWIPGRALADSVKLVGIVTESGKTLTVSQYFSALETASGELKARAFLGIDANGRTTGIGITSNETGETVFQAINFIGDAVSISSPDDPSEALLYYDTQNKVLSVKGRMILGDGYVIDSEEAIRAKDGGRWETRYKLDPNSPETPTGRHPAGWGTAMPNPSDATQIIWASTAFINADDTLSITWAIPARISGYKGNQGPQGVPGVAGANGVTTYTWIKYADSVTGTGLSNDPTGKAYIGFAYNKTTATESNTAGDYTWSLVKGEQGNQGVPGAKGADGVTTYTWIKYSNNADGTGLYDAPTAATKYIGIAVNKTVQAESSVKTDYVWSQFKGDQGPQGVPGAAGANGVTTYTWIKYADSATGAGLSNDPTGKAYIGFAYNKTTATESNTAGDYTWSLVKGEQGNQGVPGAKGADGVTTYTWIKYSDNADGTGLYDAPTVNTKYIGIAVNKTVQAESSVKTDYVWSQFKGDQGPQGVPGAAGANGVTTYTWIKYADSATGAGLSNDPTGKAYIGFAYNKTTATESNTAGDYTWSLVKGEQGNQGVPGAKGADGVTTYTWIKYSNNADGTGLYDAPTAATKYIGIAVNKTVQAESSVKTDYVWSQFKGDQGAQGLPGANGFSGAGFYRLINSNGIWPGDGAANGLFYTAFGRYPVIDDVLTFYNTNGSTYTTKRCTNAGNGSTATWAAAALLLHGDMIALGTISGSRLIAGTEISAPFIRGGQIEIGGANGTFAVDVNGGVLIKSAGTNARMEIINDRLQVYDDTGMLAVRIGRL